jgi:hypothetical protein
VIGRGVSTSDALDECWSDAVVEETGLTDRNFFASVVAWRSPVETGISPKMVKEVDPF